jgi:hypothetical protein
VLRDDFSERINRVIRGLPVLQEEAQVFRMMPHATGNTANRERIEEVQANAWAQDGWL